MDFCLDELECPFPNLEKIDLTCNLIAEDQALLPLATWPSLVEVNIWNNPLVKCRKGLSPLLRYHLTTLCGIRINRLCTQGLFLFCFFYFNRKVDCVNF